MNFWNLKYTKQRLAILQKAQAQKRHLIGLIKAKSVVADQSSSHSRHKRSVNGSLSRSMCKKDNSFASLQIQRNNQILFKKIVNTQKLEGQKSVQNTNCKFINITKNLTHNHNVIFKIKKEMKQKQIDEENTRIFSRLIQTSPTIKRNEWLRNNIQTAKYKENMNKSKYAMPDYSVEACRLMGSQSSKKYNLKVLRHNVGTAQTNSRNLKESALTNLRMRV